MHNLNDSYIELNEIFKSSRMKQRVKRYDSLMSNDCSSHETGLGLAYYSLVIQNILKNIWKY